MLLRQFVDDDLGCASYLIADPDSGEAAVVDPSYAIEPYLEAAEAEGVRLTRVLETHTHADHLSGHGRLALECGLPVHVHPKAEPEHPFEPLAEGEEVRVGRLAVGVLHTPGHRPEHCCFLVDGCVLTGDSLFVGSAARPDLAVQAQEGAEQLFASLRRLLELGDGVRVFPGHVAGSLCGSGMGAARSTTIGAERIGNPMLKHGTPEEFVAESAGVTTPRPPNMERIVALNRGPFVGAAPPLARLDGTPPAQVLDVRSPHEFASGHSPGALNVPLRASGFGTTAAFLLSPDEPVVLHASSPDEASEASQRLRSLGLLELTGYVAPAPDGARLQPVALEELGALVGAGEVAVVDVREPSERSRGYIPGSLHVPYRMIGACGSSLPRDRPLVTICESGTRAAVAASLLAAEGLEARPVLDGGVGAWHRRGGSLVSFRRCGSA